MGKHSTEKPKNTNADQVNHRGKKNVTVHDQLADQILEEKSCVLLGESYDKFINRWSNTVQKELLNPEKTKNADEK